MSVNIFLFFRTIVYSDVVPKHVIQDFIIRIEI